MLPTYESRVSLPALDSLNVVMLYFTALRRLSTWLGDYYVSLLTALFDPSPPRIVNHKRGQLAIFSWFFFILLS